MSFLKLPRAALGVLFVLVLLSNSGCTAIAVVDAVASTAVGVAKVAVKGTTAVVGAVIPDGDNKKDKD